MQPFRACRAGVVLAASYALCGVAAVQLRGQDPSEDALSAAMSVMKAVSDKEHVGEKAGPPKPSAGASPPAKLDVGFVSFASNLTAMVDVDIRNATSGPPWTAAMRDALVANVTTTVGLGLKQRFAPLKKSIGETWMALPQEEQKDAYILQLKSGFSSIFQSSLVTIENHMKLGLRRFATLSQTRDLNSTELVASSEIGVSESLLGEHCYADANESKHKTPGQSRASVLLQEEARSAMLIQETIAEAFCIQPVVAGLVHRLNDTMGLISMTTRFDAGAMSLAQQAHGKL